MSAYLEVIRGREHELPPKWDGRKVTWREPTAGRATMVCYRGRGGCKPGGDFVCTGCGAVDEPFDVYVGVVDSEPGATLTVPQERRLTSGRTYSRDVVVPAYPLVELILERCLACGHDQVLELDTDTGQIKATWDLDETDYGDDGSVPPDPETLW